MTKDEALDLALPCCGYTDASAVKWNPFNGVVQCHSCGQTYTPPAAQHEPVAWVDLLKQAEEIVRSKSLWKKYINGTPLANDIAVWMASFAQEHTTPPAAKRQWVGLTDEELELLNDCGDTDSYKFARAIEAKLKEKNHERTL